MKYLFGYGLRVRIQKSVSRIQKIEYRIEKRKKPVLRLLVPAY